MSKSLDLTLPFLNRSLLLEEIDYKKLPALDRKAFNAGIRPGQTWNVTADGKKWKIAVLYLLQTGFGFAEVTTRSHIDASLRLRDGEKLIPLMLDAEKSKIIWNLAPRVTQPNGMPKAGYEVDAILASIGVTPCSWHIPEESRNHYLTFCDEGHFLFSDYYLRPGHPCSDLCQTGKESKEVDTLLARLAGEPVVSKIPSCETETSLVTPIFSPYVLIEDMKHEKERIFHAYNKKCFPYRASDIKVNSQGGVIAKTTWSLDKFGMKSGDIFKTSVDNLLIRFHKKACGYFHINLSHNKIFPEVLQDRTIDLLSEGEEKKFEVIFNHTTKQLAIFSRCPACNSNLPIIIIPSPPKECLLKPIAKEIIAPKPTKTLKITPGKFIQYHHKLMFVHKIIPAISPYPDRYVLIDEDGKFISTTIDKNGKTRQKSRVKIIQRVPKEVSSKFIDSYGILKRDFKPEKILNKITVGSSLQLLNGKPTQVEESPRISGEECLGRLTGLERAVNLKQETTIPGSYPIFVGSRFSGSLGTVEIIDINQGQITLKTDKEKKEISLLELSLLINSGKLAVKKQNIKDLIDT